MYELNLLPGDDVELDLQMFKGARAAADILTTTENIIIETAVPIVPNPIDAGMILGIVLTSIGYFNTAKTLSKTPSGGIIWLTTSFIIMTRSPRNKTIIWRATQVSCLT